jgi:hypothetical protein
MEGVTTWLEQRSFISPETALFLAKLTLGGLAACGGIVAFAKFYLKNLYNKYNQELLDQGVDMDAFCTPPPNKSKVAVAQLLRLGSRQANTSDPIPLECDPSSHVEGLYVAAAAGKSKKRDAVPLANLMPRRTNTGAIDKRAKPTIVVASKLMI